jgi:hypothetical protein
MAKPKRHGDVEVQQDLAHERLEWKIERIGWAAIVLLLVAALAGLLGPGPLSSTTAGERGSPLWVEYDRFVRYRSPTTMRVHLGSGAARNGAVRLWVTREFVESVELHRVDPQPARVELAPDRTIYTFNVADSTRPIAVIFHLEPNRYGRMPVAVGLEAGPSVAFHQLFYP